MTDHAAPARDPAPRPNHVWVYGNDHSPWVQAALLGLHEQEIPHTLVTVPPLAVFLRSGIVMPAAKIDDGPWLLDSERILVALGYAAVEPEARRALGSSFLSSAMERTENPWRFWRAFSYVRDGHPMAGRRLWNHFWRTFSMFYFFVVITLGRRGRPQPTTDELVMKYARLQEQIAADAEFLGGASPETADLQLFGLVQMCASIPGRSLEVIREDPKLEPLRGWVGSMQRHFSDYTHLYTARIFDPKLPEMACASPLERIVYWLGAATMWLALPVTLPTTFYFVWRVRKKGLLRG